MTGSLRRRATVVGTIIALACAVLSCAPGLLGGERYQMLAATGRFDGTVALFVSGDAGIRFGMGRPVTQALTAAGVPVIGISSPSAFGATRTRAAVDAVLLGGIRRALAIPGVERIVLIGQSFGADMLAVGAPDLPPDVRSRVAAIILVVPARTAYFRADPLGLAYRRPPDAEPAAGVRSIGWVPLTCIQGARESDSLCPLLSGTRAERIVLPGGHFLQHDDAGVARLIVARVAAAGQMTKP